MKPLSAVDELDHIDLSKRMTQLDRLVEGKQIVMLGEASHGINDFYEVKAKLISYLHQHHGFNHVIFENGMLELDMHSAFESTGKRVGLESLMMDIYQNQSLKQLEGLNQTGIQLHGMDIQPTNSHATELLASFLQDHHSNEAASLWAEAEGLLVELEGRLSKSRKKEKRKECQSAYVALSELLKNDNKDTHLCDEHAETFLKGIHNRLDWLEVLEKPLLVSGTIRAEKMADNVKWLFNHRIKEAKVIVWAHNFHIRNHNPMLFRLFRKQSLGVRLKQNYESAVIGLHASTGEFADPYGRSVKIPVMSRKYTETRVTHTHSGTILFPLKPHMSHKHEKWWVYEFGMKPLPVRIDPSTAYDGMIVVPHAEPALYDRKAARI